MKKYKMKQLKKIWLKFWGWLKPYLTPKMIPIILILWCITNGIWYFLAFVHIGLPQALMTFAKAYLVFLWTIGLEKPIILAIATVIYRIIYKEEFKEKEGKL